MQQIIALQINLRDLARPLLSDLFSYDSMRITALGSPQRVAEYMGGRYTQTSRLGYLDTRRLRPGTYPMGRKKRRGKERKKVVVAAWQLVSARGVGQSTPIALLRLVIARGASQGDKGDR